jgi:Tol biopolymer transport system component
VGNAAAADIWIFDLARGTDRRLTFEAAPDLYPTWTSDGQYIIYNCATAVCARRADGGGTTVTLIKGVLSSSPPALSPDGKLLVFARDSTDTRVDLWVVDVGSGGLTEPVSATPRPLIATPRTDADPAISPDGRFIAYASSETGQFSVFVSRFPSGDGKWEASSGYGSQPRWGSDRNRFYFADNSSRIVEMEVNLSTTIEPGKILGLFRAPGAVGRGFDVSDDGERFLVSRPAGGEALQARLLVVLNGR